MTNRAADQFTRLVDIVATLHGPDGCPWDRVQTIDSLKPFVLEETYEVLDAIDHADHDALREELGDFVFEAVFLAQIESAEGRFTIADSLKSIADKLVRRHPHVFQRGAGEPTLDTPGQVRTRWEEIKKQERGGTDKPTGLLGGLSPTLPALLRAYHYGVRAASVGFDWAKAPDVVQKVQEEVDELREAVAAGAARDKVQIGVQTGVQAEARVEEEMGDLLFTIANLARKLGVEPETALRKANDKFKRRFDALERTVAATGRTMHEMTLDELEAEWQRAKLEPRHSPL